MLRKRHQEVLYNIEHNRERGPVWISPSLKITHGTFTPPDDPLEALTRLGVVWRDSRPPLLPRHFNKLDEEYARSEIQATVLKTVALTIKLQLPDFVNLFSVSRRVYNAFLSALPLWLTLDFREVNNAGDRLLSALSLTRYHNVERIDLASAKGIEDKHLKLLKTKGVQDVLSTCPRLKKFSIANNLRVTDFFIKSLVKNCKCLTDLNLCGCKNITDNSLLTIGNARLGLESLDITRCERVTDAGVIAIAEGCPSLKFLSLSGIPGVTDKCRETLSELCSNTLTTLDVDGCSGIEV